MLMATHVALIENHSILPAVPSCPYIARNAGRPSKYNNANSLWGLTTETCWGVREYKNVIGCKVQLVVLRKAIRITCLSV
jgi:hypothetical protein